MRRFFISSCTLIFILAIYFNFPLFAGQNDYNLIDTPKAYTSYKGDMRFEFSMYDDGGVLGSATLAISDFAFLGIYFDVGKLIGSENVSWNPPGVIARFLLSDGTTALPPIAIGYSYFMKGELSKVNGTIVNGIYIVASQSYFFLGYEQMLNYGVRYPVMPVEYSRPENLSFFVGTDLEVSPEFSIKGEIENIHFGEGKWPLTFYNFGVTLNVADLISLSFEFKYSKSIDRVVRMLNIAYLSQF
ncbi:MAG: hypothetical protein DRP54_01375 [Spirochaetes bacterium]|nr:MAG: hypothetical protein DRP54_01375 [Spirochaetota bacterium]